MDGSQLSVCGVHATRSCPNRVVNCTVLTGQRGYSDWTKTGSLPGGWPGSDPVRTSDVRCSGALRHPPELLADRLDHLVERLGKLLHALHQQLVGHAVHVDSQFLQRGQLGAHAVEV